MMPNTKPRLDLEDLAAEAMKREDYSPDQSTILVVSDALEEAGQQEWAEALRWLAENGKWPDLCRYGFGQAFVSCAWASPMCENRFVHEHPACILPQTLFPKQCAVYCAEGHPTDEVEQVISVRSSNPLLTCLEWFCCRWVAVGGLPETVTEESSYESD